MSVATPEAWARLVENHEAAIERWAVTLAALEAVPAQRFVETAEEQAHEGARVDLDAREDELLAATPPHLEALAYQLKIFAERFHATDVAAEPMAGEDQREGPILRRIYSACLQIAAAEPRA